MADTLTFHIVVYQDETRILSAPLSFEALGAIISDYPKTDSHDRFMELAAQHAAISVREAVASKDRLTEKTVSLLASDSNPSVLSNLVSSAAFRRFATLSVLQDIAKKDMNIARTIADCLDSFERVSPGELAEFLITLEDHSVLLAMANNWRTPVHLLRQLEKCQDPAIASQAKATIAST